MLKQDGKLFGKISIIDIGALLAAIVLIVGIAIRFSGNEAVQVTAGKNLECVVLVENVRQYNVDALKKGGAVFDKETKEYIGEITEVTSQPATHLLTMADGSCREVLLENRYDAYVTIAFSGKVSDTGYYTDTNRQMSVGASLNMNAKFSQCESKIQEVRLAENE